MGNGLPDLVIPRYWCWGKGVACLLTYNGFWVGGLSVLFGCQISDWAGSEVRNPKSERGKLHHLTPSLLGFGSLAGWMSIGIWTCRGILYNEPTSVVSPEHGVLRSLAGYP